MMLVTVTNGVVVRYGTNASLNWAVTNLFLGSEHAVALDDLIPGRTYFFSVASEDQAGNRSTNGGALLSFVAPRAATVLVVENYQHDGFGSGPDDDAGPNIPLGVYTNTLNQIDVEASASITGSEYQPTHAKRLKRPQRIANLHNIAIVINKSARMRPNHDMNGDTLPTKLAHNIRDKRRIRRQSAHAQVARNLNAVRAATRGVDGVLN